jgi:hypothetical protein
VVRAGGRVFEILNGLARRRRPLDVYHAAMEVSTSEGRYAIELAPASGPGSRGEGVVGEGAVGSRAAGRLRVFRYELRCRLGGSIPDLDWAVGGPRRLVEGESGASRLIESLSEMPLPTWGRDELQTGEMWTSNSVVSWALTTCGAGDVPSGLPPGGTAPGWSAGSIVARRRFI